MKVLFHFEFNLNNLQIHIEKKFILTEYESPYLIMINQFCLRRPRNTSESTGIWPSILAFINFFPLFCFSSNFFFLVISPP